MEVSANILLCIIPDHTVNKEDITRMSVNSVFLFRLQIVYTHVHINSREGKLTSIKFTRHVSHSGGTANYVRHVKYKALINCTNTVSSKMPPAPLSLSRLKRLYSNFLLAHHCAE